MLGQIARLFASGKSQIRPPSPLVALVIDTLGPQITEARNFEPVLCQAIERACTYFERQIAAIPDAGPLTAATAGQSTLFGEAGQIIQALGRSLEVKDSLPGLARSGHQQIYALLGMRSNRRQDETCTQPTRFADHTIRSLAPDLSAARDYLRLVAFKRLLTDFAAHVDKLRRKERLLKLEWNIQNRIVSTPESDDSTQSVDAAHELIPDNLLRGLVAWLETPELFFRLEPSGIALTAPCESELPLLHCSDRRQWLVCFAAFSTADGLRGLEQETHAHRYMLI